MASEHFNARPVFPSGVRHANVPHTANFTVVGNHLAQHRELSLTARGLALYIQSVPGGTRIGIKDLAALFTEGEIRIAAALRELERAGYLRRTQEHLPGGRLVTRTVSYNQPGARTDPDQDPLPPPRPPRHRRTRPTPAPVPPSPPAPPPSPPEVRPEAQAVPEPEPAPEPEPTPEPEPAPERRSPLRVPAPTDVNPARHRAATALLVRLRRTDHRLLLDEAGVQRLAPGVEAWMERGASSDALVNALTRHLPAHTTYPEGLLAHRLREQLPPLLGPVHREPAYVPPVPFQTCEKCDRAYRSPTRGTCRGCSGEAGSADAA